MADRILIASGDLWSMRDEIAALTGAEPLRLAAHLRPGAGEILAWADRRGRGARALARLTGRRLRTISEGPLGYLRPGPDARPFSLMLKAQPVPHPARNAHLPGDGAAQDGAELWRRLRLSWRNDGRDRLPEALRGRPFVLVVASLPLGESAQLVRTAALQHPGRLIAVIADSRLPAAQADAVARAHPGVVPIRGTHPSALFEAAEAVFAPPDSDLGREAVLAGRPPAGAGARSAAELFAETVLAGPVYFDPWSRAPGGFAAVADRVAWLRDRFHENDRPTICIGVSRWKRRQTAAFLDGPDGPPRFAETVGAAVSAAEASSGRVVVWETRTPRGLADSCRDAAVPLVRMEDGFLRSVGLGAAFQPGASAILDTTGIYYDPRRPSDLERILAESEFTSDLLERARRLRERIVALRLSKYNVGRAGSLAGLPEDRAVVLVPGQVEDDASVLFGSPKVRGNRALLEAARRLNPDAFLIFKPHPDVAAGLRQGRIEEADALRFADRIVTDLPITDLLDRVDQVETMTSLTGFEALLRGKRVAVHGQPFYAGWGLTLDHDPPARRGRPLGLDALVAGALILYPRYLDPATGLRCPPEILVDRLAAARDAAAATSPVTSQARAAYVRARYALLGPLAHLLRRARGSIRAAPGSSPADRPR